MNLGKIKSYLKNYQPKPVDIRNEFAVAIPLIFNKTKQRWELVYEVRSRNINQPSEISFPGGKLENDEEFSEAAIRETMEELNLSKENVDILGELDYIVTPGNLIIKSFLTVIKDIEFNQINYNRDEVEKLFTVPLDYFLNEDPLVSTLTMTVDQSEDFPYELIPNGRNYNFAKGKNHVTFYKYKDYIIWGFTAKITKRFIEIFKELNDII
ncbi:MAG: CoA pyrophosphatase [Tissierellia bacterium]|nr:CoA pyrophosphatase [Tissierellia bacterium]